MTQEPSEPYSEDPTELGMRLVLTGLLKPTGEAFAERLMALEKARVDLIEADDYGKWRASIRNDLAESRGFRRTYGFLLPGLVFLSLGVGFFGLYTAERNLLYGGMFLALILLLTVVILAVDSRRKTRLTTADRLVIVDFLQVNSSITDVEAENLRVRIRTLQAGG